MGEDKLELAARKTTMITLKANRKMKMQAPQIERMNHQQFLDNKTMKWYPRMFLGCIRLAFGDYIKSVTKNAEERWRSFLGSCQTLKNLVAKAKQCLEN